MTYFEGVTTAIAVVALIVSAVALHRAGRANKIAEEANELAQAPAALAKVQLEQEEARRHKTNVSLDLVKHQTLGGNGKPQTSYRFRLTNEGEVVAREVGLEILTEDSPIVSQDYAAKFPAQLAPKQSIETFAAIYLGSPSRYDAVVFWTNPDGSQERQERVVTM